MSFLEKLKDKKSRREIMKFALVGIATTIVDFGLMAIVIFAASPSSFNYNFFNAIFNMPTADLKPKTFTVVMATGLGFFISFLANYLCSVFFVYHYGNVGKNKSGFLKFLLFALAGLIVHTLGEFIGYHLLHINVWLIKIVLSLAIFIFNYFTRKYFIFNLNLIYDEENTIRL